MSTELRGEVGSRQETAPHPGAHDEPRRSDPNQHGRFIKEVLGDEPEIAAKLRIEERELEAGGPN